MLSSSSSSSRRCILLLRRFFLPRPSSSSSTTSPCILYEDRHVLGIDKPSGLLSQSNGNSRCVVDVLSSSRSYLVPVHRLDRNVSGCMVLAKSSKSAKRLSEAFRNRRVEKDYVAIVRGQVEGREGVLENRMRRANAKRVELVAFDDRSSSSSSSSSSNSSSSQTRTVRLRWKLRARGTLVEEGQDAKRRVSTPITMLDVRLETGFKHQIRAQLALALGAPILGDRKYGGGNEKENASRKRSASSDRAIALHARSLAFPHPVPSTAPAASVSLESPAPLDRWVASFGAMQWKWE